MTQSTTPPRAPGAGRALKITLALSLAVNLAVAGMVAGAFLRGGPMQGGVREIGFGPLTEALDPRDRDALRGAFLDRGPDLRAMRNAMRADTAALVAALRAEPFDQAVFLEALAAQSRRLTERAELGQALMAERVAAMSPAERAAFADRIEAGQRRGRDGARHEDERRD